MRIGSLEYEVTGDASGLRRVLAEAVAEGRAAMAALDAEDATVEIKARTTQLERSVGKAEAIIAAIDGQKATVEVDLDANRFQRGIAAIQKDMRESTLAITKHNSELASLRQEYAKLYTARQKVDAQDLGRTTNRETLEAQRLESALAHVGARIRAMGGDTRDLNQNLDKNNFSLSSFARRLGTIGRTRVNLGPISTSLRNFGIAATALSPLLFSLIGAASALVGTVGAGLVGAFGVAAGAASGFGLAVLPLLPSLKQLFTEAKAAPSIGGALKKMKDSLTGGIRPHFMQDAHAAITTLKADFPTFQRAADGAFKAVSSGFQGWMRGLRSPEAQHILSNLIGNFTKDVGPAMHGLGSLATAFGRFISIASGSGPGIAHTFQDWAAGIEHSTQAGTGFAGKVQSLISQAKSLGSALSATGRLAVAFFGAGARSGQDLLDSLTRSENRMTAWMHTVAGQRSLHTFFKDAVANTKQLFSALAPLVSTFVHLGNALAPVTTGALKFATFIGDIVHAVASLAPARVSLQLFGATIAGLFVLNKLTGWAGGIRGIAASLGLLAGVEDANTAATAANTAALEANTAARAGNVGATAAGDAALAANTAETEANAAAQGGLLAQLGGFAGITGGAVAGITAVAGGLALLAYAGAHSHNNIDSARASLAHYHDMTKQMAPSLQAETQATRNAISADKAAAEAKDHLFKTTRQFMKGDASLAQVQRAQEQVTQTQQRATTANKQTVNTQRQMVTSSERVAQAQKAVRDATNAVATAQGKGAVAGRAGPQAAASVAREAAAAQKALAAANIDLAQAQQRQTFDQLNQARAMHGLAPIAQNVAKDFGHLQEVIGKQNAVKLAISASPAQTAQIAKIATDLRKLGGTHKAKLIIQGAKSPEQAIKGLQRLDAQQLRKKVLRVESAGATHAAQANLSKVDAKRLKEKALRILTNTGNVNAAIAAITGKKLPPKTQQFHKNGDAAVLSTYQQIAALPDTTVTTTFLGVKKGFWGAGGGHFQGGIVPGFASGGALDWMMRQAHEAAGRANGIDASRGARVNTPRYIVGEEPGRTEYIITDNPAYRRSNLMYLQEAAAALGAAILPGHKKGKGGKKGGPRAPAYDPEAPTLDEQTSPNSYYQALEDQVNYDSSKVDLLKRQLSAFTAGVSIGSVTGAIDQEVRDYQTLASWIVGLIGTRGPQTLMQPVPQVPKQAKTKGQKKAKAKAQARHDAAQANNQAVQSNYASLADELRSINDIIIPGLLLDKQDALTGQEQAIAAQNASFNAVSLDIFRNFSSNIGTIAGTTFGGAGGPALTPSSLGYDPFSTIESVSGQGVVSTQTTPAMGQGSSVNIVNNFGSPPPDPFTWTQQQAFEVQAA